MNKLEAKERYSYTTYKDEKIIRSEVKSSYAYEVLLDDDEVKVFNSLDFANEIYELAIKQGIEPTLVKTTIILNDDETYKSALSRKLIKTEFTQGFIALEQPNL